jgi:hypothetical protein
MITVLNEKMEKEIYALQNPNFSKIFQVKKHFFQS